ncbi:MAG: T9SS type A sorting domain-containing protein [Bacteroidota bacterium]
MKNLFTLLKPFRLILILLSPALIAQDIQWEQLGGPHGGAVYSIVSDNSGIMYASSMWNNGPYKSIDNGESWVSIQNGMTPGSQYCPMNICPNGDLFVAGIINSDNCIYRSADGGTNWTISLNTAGWSIFCISFDQDNNIYVGTYSGIYKSTDNGDNWTPYGTLTGRAVAIAVNDSGHVFVGDYGVFYRSTDDGASWAQLAVSGGTTIAINKYGHLFVGCSGNGGILRSTDNGDSWTYVYPAYTIQIQEASTVLIDANDDIYFPTYDGKGVIKSTDNGDTWTEMNNNLGYKYLRVVGKNSLGDFFTAGDYAIYKSIDGCAHWYSTGLPLCNVKGMAINPYDDIFTAEWGVNRSTDLGQTWETIYNGLTNLDSRTFVIKDDGTIFCGAGFSNSDQGVIFRSSDNGNNWVRADTGIAWSTHLNAMAVDITGNIYAGAYDGVYKSTNNGSSWINIGGAGGAKGLAFNSTGDLFLASYGGGLWKLPEGTTTWIDLTSNYGSDYIYTMFMGSNDYIYTDQKRSTDNGQTWTNYSVEEFVYSVAENSAGHLFFGTNSYGQGIYRSKDYGNTWELINSGFPSPGIDINTLAVDSDDYLYAGTNGKSIFKTTTSTVVSVDELRYAPLLFNLKQNYPNPFNNVTEISWNLVKAGHVLLKVFDFTGREVKTLVDSYHAKGEHSVKFYANELPTGVYFYQLRLNGLVETRKLILLR